jgi:hypothetical protein
MKYYEILWNTMNYYEILYNTMKYSEILWNTIKYYNKSYNWIRQKEPRVWIDGLLRSLNISKKDYKEFKNMDKFNLICYYLINIFHRNIFK